jgi:hypothetical protein
MGEGYTHLTVNHLATPDGLYALLHPLTEWARVYQFCRQSHRGSMDILFYSYFCWRAIRI